jgi:PTS system nitrogen regulatory IIA component
MAELARRLAEADSRVASADFELALTAREAAQYKSVGFGVAIPHAPFVAVDRAGAGLVTLATPIDYGAGDGAPVDVVFVTVGPPSARVTHLQTMSTLAGLILCDGVIEALRAARDDDELWTALDAAMAKSDRVVDAALEAG